jgi:hypothetical protein
MIYKINKITKNSKNIILYIFNQNNRIIKKTNKKYKIKLF